MPVFDHSQAKSCHGGHGALIPIGSVPLVPEVEFVSKQKG